MSRRSRRRFRAAFIVTVGLGATFDTAAQPRARPSSPIPPLAAGHVIDRDRRGVCRLHDHRACGGTGCTEPRPVIVACPEGLERERSMYVLGGPRCEIGGRVHVGIPCPPTARCNPPPRRAVACPGQSAPVSPMEAIE